MITIGILVIISLHMLSTGVKPDGRASRPSLLLMEVLRPFQALESALTYGASGLVHDYFDLVGVREQNVELRKQLAELQSERARLVE